MAQTCSKCSKPAITFIRYNGTHLCADHFSQFVRKRVKKDMKKQGGFPPNSRVAVAISGGKDSHVALFLVHEILKERKNIELYAISVDEGIDNYRDESLIIAKEFTKSLDVPHIITTFKDKIGYTMDQISTMKSDFIGACSYCGVFRRFCLNTTAKELGITRLITGHNLDDIAQSILMNFVNADMEKLARLGPHEKVQPGLIPRMMILRSIPEKENVLFALLNNITYHDGICPYSPEAFRGVFSEIIYNLEEKNPGTRHSILKSYDSIKEILLAKYPPTTLHACKECGEPTTHEYCKRCKLIFSLNNQK